MGDRLLLVLLGDDYYHFATCDTVEKKPSITNNINFT